MFGKELRRIFPSGDSIVGGIELVVRVGAFDHVVNIRRVLVTHFTPGLALT